MLVFMRIFFFKKKLIYDARRLSKTFSIKVSWKKVSSLSAISRKIMYSRIEQSIAEYKYILWNTYEWSCSMCIRMWLYLRKYIFSSHKTLLPKSFFSNKLFKSGVLFDVRSLASDIYCIMTRKYKPASADDIMSSNWVESY